MFEYARDKRKVLIALGQFVSRDIIRNYKDEETLNKLNREKLAYDFYNGQHPNWLAQIAQVPDREIFIDDVARWIDKQIPKSFLKWKYELHDLKPSQIDPDQFDHGLIYHYQFDIKKFSEKYISSDG
ncbi:hypothetical protein M5X00_05405 [Paenibacillus alvei]|uniref:hypothetical protein n=1 Tax=Paenibacillus TaxID=44249 RepID=UPI0002880143|nr:MULTISPECIES: hypothetical protein [Paenibacillus]EJW13743.1 hypothetical protein PAV_14p00030 [Paenibacillus alvei DSM 29]MCY9542938.1 hypothetical protein [Paenibacillus alvei]MCY9702595.1 hypothetical protein [Paenibacillus alvei]MCY9732626.1 hypothetical protein [Paenibacillus alvei]MCY9753695.1 hypothetical protein [Paenibacillus alvei]